MSLSKGTHVEKTALDFVPNREASALRSAEEHAQTHRKLAIERLKKAEVVNGAGGTGEARDMFVEFISETIAARQEELQRLRQLYEEKVQKESTHASQAEAASSPAVVGAAGAAGAVDAAVEPHEHDIANEPDLDDGLFSAPGSPGGLSDIVADAVADDGNWIF